MVGRHGRRWLFVTALALALAFPAAALAVRYLGPVDNGNNNAGIEIDFQVGAGGAPKKITQVEWHNVVGFVSCESSDHFYKVMRVKNGTFEGSGHPGEVGNPDWPRNPNVIETIKGTFKHHHKKIVGTLRLQGTPGGGCDGIDTGKLPYVAK
jgi:hypothetical protein